MKLNMNKIYFLLLLSISIGLNIFLFAVSIFTTYSILQYFSITLIFLQGLFAVKSIHKYTLWIEK